MDGKHFLTTLDFTVATYDIDIAGHVNNQVYIRWLEDLRLVLLDNSIPLKDLMQENIFPIITRTEIEYKRAIKMFELVVGSIWLSKSGPLRVILDAGFTVDGELCASARHECVFISTETNRPVRVPPKFR